MNTLRTLGFAAVAALSLGFGAAMAQEGPANDTETGAAYFGNGARVMQPQVAHQPGVQSGSSDVDMRPSTNAQWHPGNPYNNEGGQG
jgi:hypothetical protein